MLKNKRNLNKLIRLLCRLGIVFQIIFVVLSSAAAQETNKQSTITKKVPLAKTSNVEKKTGDDAALKPKVATRIEIKTGEGVTPPLITTAVGQVTTITLPEAPLQIRCDKLGLNINESNENSKNHYVYIIPIKSGIRRNIVIEMESGKIEFELQSIAAESGKTAVFTREVLVKSIVEERAQKNLEAENNSLKQRLEQKVQELSGIGDRLDRAAQNAQLSEMKIQGEILLAFAKLKKGRTSSSPNKDWLVTELLSSRTGDGSREISIVEIEYKGKNPGRFVEVKSENGARLFWAAEKTATSKTVDGYEMKRGEKLRLFVIEFTGAAKSAGIIFATDKDIVKLN